MNWKSISANYGKIIKSEVFRRYHSKNDPNLDWEDYWQTAALTAWELCRDKKEEEIDRRVLRIRIRDVLYDLSAKGRGIHVPGKAYKKWLNGETPAGITRVSSLDSMFDSFDSGTGDPYFANGCPDSLRGDDTELSVAAFISTLPRDELKMLAYCLHFGYRSPQTLARAMAKPYRDTARTLYRLRKRCIDYFDCRFAA